MTFKSEFFIEDLLYNQERKFCTYSNANIYVTTFNVNGKAPPGYLGDWLHFDTSNLPDFIAIGLQEMDLALGTYVMDSTIRQDEWLFSLKNNLPNIYKQVDCVRLIGIFLVLYVRNSSPFNVSEIHTASVPTGFFGKLGNKGGVGISLNINDTSICIINSHLAAGGSELARRNQDFRDISQMRFPHSKGIYDHDAVIWLGDLNYRLNAPLSFEEVVHRCNSNRHLELIHYDQLKEQQKERTAFNSFHEASPTFRPTYKYDAGTTNWDTSEKRRIPAWCDRILFWVRDKNVELKQSTYTSVETVVFSDHKPVISSFNAQVKRVDKSKRLALYDELLKDADRRANDLLPQLYLSKTEFNIGPVYYQVPSVDILTIRNMGLTSTHFVFTNRHESLPSLIPPNWLTVTPNSSFIAVGSEVDVTLQVYVGTEEAARIEKEIELSCILVLRLDGGRDYFVVVSAKFVPPIIHPVHRLKPSELEDEPWLINFDEAPSQSSSSNNPFT